MERYKSIFKEAKVTPKTFEEPTIIKSYSGKDALQKALQHEKEWESVIYVKDEDNKTLSFHLMGNDSNLYDLLSKKRAYRGKVFNSWQEPLRFINFDEYEIDAFEYAKNLPKIVPISILWDKYSSNSSFYGGIDETNNLYKTTQQNIYKFGKNKVPDIEDYHYSWSSRGGWALYIAKSLDPNDVAILVDFDKDFYTSK